MQPSPDRVPHPARACHRPARVRGRLQPPRYRTRLTPIRPNRRYAAAMRSRPLVVDSLIAAALTVVALLLGPEAARHGQQPLATAAYALRLLTLLPLVFRVRPPV